MAAFATEDVTKYSFDHPEMLKSSLENTVDVVDAYDRHVFLCYKRYEFWPSSVEDPETDLLPKLLSSALKARMNDIEAKTRLTICGGYHETQFSDGDVLIFPEMMKYRGLKESDVDAFVEDVLVNGKPRASGIQEPLAGVYVFVCDHDNRDEWCGTGVCGPILIEKFEEELESRELTDQVFVLGCSHDGGHKYAGNVIIFGTNAEGKVIGDWYGYVTPNDVPDLIDLAIDKGEVIERLWRARMGLFAEEPNKEDEKTELKEKDVISSEEQATETKVEEVKEKVTSGCQGVHGVSCCRDESATLNGDAGDESKPNENPAESWKNRAVLCLPSCCFGKWEQSDVWMAAAVVLAVATVAVAYSFYRRSG